MNTRPVSKTVDDLEVMRDLLEKNHDSQLSELTYHYVFKEKWRVRVGSKQDERAMRSASRESGTFLIRTSEEGCIIYDVRN